MPSHVLIDHLAAYDLWANSLFVKRLDTEPTEVLDRETKSSFPTLRLTLLHIRNAEAAWLSRIKGEEQKWPAEEDESLGTVLKHSVRMRDHAGKLSDIDLAKEMNYTDLKGNLHRQPIWQMLLHCFNHGTYHRGQLVTMMRAMDVDEIPHSDLVIFQRSLRKA